MTQIWEFKKAKENIYFKKTKELQMKSKKIQMKNKKNTNEK